MKKRREFWPRLQEKSSSARFFLQPSVAFWPDFNQNFVFYRMNVISGASFIINGVMGIFSPTTFKKVIFFWIFRQSDPPKEESKCKNAQFLQWIL